MISTLMWLLFVRFTWLPSPVLAFLCKTKKILFWARLWTSEKVLYSNCAAVIGENYIYIIFKILNCKNTCRFENFAKIAPCRQLLGRQVPCRPSTWRQGAICKLPGGRGPAAQAVGGRPPAANWLGGRGSCRQLLGRQAPQPLYKPS